MAAKPRSITREKRPSSVSRFSSSAHIIGDKVSAITPETITEPASEKANSRKSAPVMPPRSPIGA